MPGENLKYYHLLAIIFSAIVFWARLSDVGSNPAGYYCDEAAIAFNARSILETGKDEHGRSYPIYFKSYGDYKSAIYIYSVAVAQKIFGADTDESIHFSTRLPAAIFMALVLPLIYLILARTIHPVCGLLSLPLLATEPWLHHFSHIGFSLTAIPFLLAAGFYFWVEGIECRQKSDFCLSAFFFSVAFYTYAPARVFVPLLGAGLLFFYRRKMSSGARISFIITALICSLPFLSYLLFEEDFLTRVNYLNVFTTPYLSASQGYKWLSQKFLSYDLRFESVDPFTSIFVFIWNYAKQLSPSFLFFDSGPNLKFGPGDSGILQPLTAFGLIAGIIASLIKRTPFHLTLLYWVLIFPIPVALTWEDIPHAGRAIVAHPALNILATLGLWHLCNLVRAIKYKKIKYPITALFLLSTTYVYCTNSLNRLNFYREQYSIRSSGWMQYGIREIVEYVRNSKRNYREIRFITTGLLYEPEMQILMYTHYPAALWQKRHKLPLNMKIIRKATTAQYLRPDTLYIFSPPPPHIPPTAEILKKVFWEDGIGEAAVILRLKSEKSI